MDINKETLKQWIEQSDYKTVRDLADEIGISETTISKWITGSKQLTNIHQKLWYYFIQCHELKKSVDNKEKENIPTIKEINERINELHKEIELLKAQKQ